MRALGKAGKGARIAPSVTIRADERRTGPVSSQDRPGARQNDRQGNRRKGDPNRILLQN
jgi:hypothetical protein